MAILKGSMQAEAIDFTRVLEPFTVAKNLIFGLK
jgi:hypothetical protein